MSNTQTSLPADVAKPAPSEPLPDVNCGLVAAPDREAWSDLGLGDAAGLTGHTLLSRSPAPEGRRSLFRR
jgi:hypothetical protein